MNERAAGKSKSDVALQAHSAKETKGKGKCFDKGRGGYNKSNDRGNQIKGDVVREYLRNERANFGVQKYGLL